MARSTNLLAILLLAAMTFSIGCTQRTIHVTSEPSGALVHLNDEEVGRTPLSVPFTFYGTYDVRLEAEGYAPLWTAAEAEMPWWEFPGPDLVAEMIPGSRSDIRWHFTLAPAPSPEDVDVDALQNRADTLRSGLSDTD